MLVSVNIPTTDATRSGQFYKHLLGGKLGEHPHAKEALFSHVASCALTMFPRHKPEERTTCYFEVGDLHQAIKDLVGLGGKLIVEPFHIKAGAISREAAVVSDPDGNAVGLVTGA